MTLGYLLHCEEEEKLQPDVSFLSLTFPTFPLSPFPLFTDLCVNESTQKAQLFV